MASISVLYYIINSYYSKIPMRQQCIKHPEKKGSHLCSKYLIYLCDDCLACSNPKGYCKFRTSCMINEFQKQKNSLFFYEQ